MQEVSSAPLRRESINLPLLVDVEKCEVVGLRDKELLTCGVTLLFSVFWSEEDCRHRQHGHNSKKFISAPKLLRDDEHLAQRRVEWKLYHLSAKLGEAPSVVKSSQHPQLIHGVQNVVLGRRIHKFKLK